MRARNYFGLVVIFGAVMGVWWLVMVLFSINSVSIHRRMEYITLTMSDRMMPRFIDRIFIELAETRYRYIFVSSGSFPTDIVSHFDIQDEVCRNDLRRLWKSFDVWDLLNRKQISDVFYQCGLLAYREGDNERALSHFQLASTFCPEWSYYYLELAALYNSTGKLNEAVAAYNRCFNNKMSRGNCQRVYNSMLKEKTHYEVGYWEEDIFEVNNHI